MQVVSFSQSKTNHGEMKNGQDSEGKCAADARGERKGKVDPERAARQGRYIDKLTTSERC